MRLIRCLSDFKGTPNGVSLAIGNFDGFHKGHQAVVEAMKEKARIYDLTSAVMIFEPQPLEFFSKSNAPARLYSLRDKLQALEVAGVKLVFCMKFDSKFASMSAHDYVIELLHKRLGVKSVTVGTEFNFGKGGAYTIEDLKTIGSEVSMDAQAIDGVEIDGIRVSSTRIRSYLCEGRLDLARAALGRYYSISGAVVHGFAFGRTLGFATANVNINRRISPLSGVFAVKVFCPFWRRELKLPPAHAMMVPTNDGKGASCAWIRKKRQRCCGSWRSDFISTPNATRAFSGPRRRPGFWPGRRLWAAWHRWRRPAESRT